MMHNVDMTIHPFCYELAYKRDIHANSNLNSDSLRHMELVSMDQGFQRMLAATCK